MRQNVLRLLQLHHESTLTGEEVIVGTDARKDSIDRCNFTALRIITDKPPLGH